MSRNKKFYPTPTTQSDPLKTSFKKKSLFSRKTLTPLYLDVDDVILNSSETIISILNNRYSTSYTIYDLKDWGYRSICPTLTDSELSEIFESELFWSKVKVRPSFLSILESHVLDNYYVHLTTHCSSTTKLYKTYLLTPIFSKYVPHFDFTFIPVGTSKSVIDMSGGIQVDDNLSNLLSTNASLKILLTNLLETNYNGAFDHSTVNVPNLYICPTLPDVQDVLQFNSTLEGGLY